MKFASRIGYEWAVLFGSVRKAAGAFVRAALASVATAGAYNNFHPHQALVYTKGLNPRLARKTRMAFLRWTPTEGQTRVPLRSTAQITGRPRNQTASTHPIGPHRSRTSHRRCSIRRPVSTTLSMLRSVVLASNAPAVTDYSLVSRDRLCHPGRTSGQQAPPAASATVQVSATR